MATEFDPTEHETQIAEAYERIARVDAFDKFVDLALEGTITMDEALKAYREEYAPGAEPC